LKYGDDFLDEFLFFFTFLGYRELGKLDKFLSNGDGYCKGYMIGCKSPVRMDNVAVKFTCPIV